MSRSYWRVAPAFWGDEKVTSWSDDGRLLALYLLTCEHRTLEALFRLPKGYILADLGWSSERLAEPFAELLRDGFIEYDETVRVCLIVNALSYQAPENPNQVAAGLKLLEELPETCLFARLFEQAQRFCQRLAEGLAQRFPERLGQPPAPAPAPAPTPAPSLTPEIPKEEAAAVAREDGEDAGSSSDSLREEEGGRPPVDEPLLWELRELPQWPLGEEEEEADLALLRLVAMESPRASPASTMAEYRLVAAQRKVNQPRQLYRKIARDIHGKQPAVRAAPEPPAPVREKSPEEWQEQAALAAEAAAKVRRLATGAAP